MTKTGLIIAGLSHKTAPIEVREQVIFPDSSLESALRELKSGSMAKSPNPAWNVNESLIISTCNRTEVLVVKGGNDPCFEEIEKFILDFNGIKDLKLAEYTYRLTEHDAIFHLFKVASGLDSMVPGETEILGQVKDAYSAAVRTNTAGLILHKLLPTALRVGKQVRTETAINKGSLSASKVAYKLAEKIFSNISRARVLLVGAGQTGRQAAHAFVENGGARLAITNRTLQRAEELADELGAEVIPFDEFSRRIGEFDIVLCATDSPRPVIKYEDVLAGVRKRKREFFILDLAVPRDVEPAAGDIEDIFLYNIDDLEQIVDQNRAKREAEIEKAFTLVNRQVEHFHRWHRSLRAASAIEGLQERFDEIRRREIDRDKHRFSEKDLENVDALTRAMLKKMLQVPILQLRELTDTEEDPGGIVHFFKKIFGLDSK